MACVVRSSVPLKSQIAKGAKRPRRARRNARASSLTVFSPASWTLRLLQFDSFFPELLINQPSHQRFQLLARLGENEVFLFLGPVKLETRGQRGNPDLADRRVRRDHKPRPVLETDMQRS